MINKVSFRNYKAFDEGELELKPLTFILGANNSGKSSLLHLQLLLSQTLTETGVNSSSAMSANSYFINMGEDNNLVKDRSKSIPFTLSFDLNREAYFTSLLQKQKDKDASYVSDYLKYLKVVDTDAYKKLFDNVLDELNQIIENRKSHKTQSRERIDSVHNSFDIELFYLSMLKQHADDHLAFLNQFSGINSLKCINYELRSFSNALTEISKTAKTVVLRYEFKLLGEKEKLQIAKCEILVDDVVLIGFYPDDKRMISVSSQILDQQLLEELSLQYPLALNFQCLFLSSPNKDKTASLFQEFVSRIFAPAYVQLHSRYNSKNLLYIGPLRADPQRYYFLDGSVDNKSLNCKNPNVIANILKANDYVTSQINDWLKRFGYKVSVDEYKDIINNIKVTQYGQQMDLTDVGFGISQLLPILIAGFMGTSDSMTIIEQPEIHLHPRLQAELADLFMEIIKTANSRSQEKTKRVLLVETHSEYILKRIRRRIAEHKLSVSDVAIYFVNPRTSESGNTASLYKVNIGSNGNINWPKDFYMTEFEDDMAFLKAATSK